MSSTKDDSSPPSIKDAIEILRDWDAEGHFGTVSVPPARPDEPDSDTFEDELTIPQGYESYVDELGNRSIRKRES
ncbi:MAG: hypothetical protein WC787_01690 [Patescibacteria group bacterium]|jgi:hypothetical protein